MSGIEKLSFVLRDFLILIHYPSQLALESPGRAGGPGASVAVHVRTVVCILHLVLYVKAL